MDVSGMKQFDIEATSISGLKRIKARKLDDARGSFSRVFCIEELGPAGWPGYIAQANVTTTRNRGTVRGLHYQVPPYAEAKIIRCLRGEVWDVVLDLRQDSETFLQWHAEVLSDTTGIGLLVPPGCAHGFQTLRADVEMLYFHSSPYSSQCERGVLPTDPLVNIPCPAN